MKAVEAEAHQLRSWSTNADAWSDAVRAGRIASRREATDAAIIRTTLASQPRTLLDLGCGEGWLVRELRRRGVDAHGVDGIPELIALARRAGEDAHYSVFTFDAIVKGALGIEPVDVVVANFSLLSEAGTVDMVGAVPRLLAPGGRFVVQTAHPAFVEVGPYRSGWRPGSWDGFGDAFVDPAPWYFRTLSDWVARLREAGLSVVAIEEPLGPDERPRSIILVGSAPAGEP